MISIRHHGEPNAQRMVSIGSNMVQFRLPMLPPSDGIEWNAKVNGEEVSIFIESNAILLDVLRDRVGSLGTKRGCDMGTCGCCSVLVDLSLIHI